MDITTYVMTADPHLIDPGATGLGDGQRDVDGDGAHVVFPGSAADSRGN